MSATDLLAAWKSATKHATPGPWEADGAEITQSWTRPEPWETVVSGEVKCMSYCYGGSCAPIRNDADAAFIVAARTAMPKLVAALEAVLVACEDRKSGGSPLLSGREIRAIVDEHLEADR